MYRWLFTVLVIASMILVNSCGLSDDTVAKVGGIEIAKDDFVQNLSRRFPNKENYQDVSQKEKMAVLDKMVEQALKLSAAYDQDMDKEEKLVKEYTQRKMRALGNKYFEREVVDILLPEKELKDNFDRQANEVKSSHILIGYAGLQRSQATRSQEEALALAKDLASRARAGEDFGALAETYSEDPSAKSNKGDLGYFTWGKMVMPFQEAAFSMEPGAISDPVLSDFGYHVILVQDIRPNKNHNPDDFENQVFNLKRSLYQAKQSEGRQMWDEHIAKIKENKNFKVNEENIASVVDLIKTKLDAGEFDSEKFTENELKTVLVEWKGGKAALGDVFDMYGERLARYADRMRDVENFTTDVDNIATQVMIVAEAEKKGYDKESDVREQLDDFLEQRMVSLLDQKEVNDKIVVEDEDMKKYYEENKQEFTNPEEIQIWEIFVKDEAQAKKVLKLAQSGRDFEKLAGQYSEDKYYQKKKGNLGFKRENSRGAVSKEAFNVGPDKIAGPVKYNKGWAIIKTGEKKPETLRSYEDVQVQLKSKVRSEKIRQRKKEWEESLKDKYTVKINEELVEKI